MTGNILMGSIANGQSIFHRYFLPCQRWRTNNTMLSTAILAFSGHFASPVLLPPSLGYPKLPKKVSPITTFNFSIPVVHFSLLFKNKGLSGGREGWLTPRPITLMMECRMHARFDPFKTKVRFNHTVDLSFDKILGFVLGGAGVRGGSQPNFGPESGSSPKRELTNKNRKKTVQYVVR